MDLFSDAVYAFHLGIVGLRGGDTKSMVELAPVPFPEPLERILSSALELGERGEMTVNDAVPDLKEWVGQLEGFARWKP